MFLKKSVRASRNIFLFNLEYDCQPLLIWEKIKPFLLNINVIFNWLVLRRNKEYLLKEKVYKLPLLQELWGKQISKDPGYLQSRSYTSYLVTIVFLFVSLVFSELSINIFGKLFKNETLSALSFVIFIVFFVFGLTIMILNMLDNKNDAFLFLSTEYDYNKFVSEIVILYCREQKHFAGQVKKRFPLTYADSLHLAAELDNVKI